jgi:hypothetical protein
MANPQVAVVELAEVACGNCAGVYAISERYRAHKQTHGGYWHCPYCQGSWGFGKSEIAKVREQAEAEKARHQETLARLNQETAEKAKVEKTLARERKRTQAGVCTCCNRTFVNLARHMATKHSVG